MGTAAVFLANQKDYKRLLAYSSIEHMGILFFGVGLGGLGAYGALFHTMNHSLAKAALFLTAGTILHTYRTKDVALVAGMGQRVPYSAALWTAGFLAITGFPPFATFFSEFIIIRESFSSGRALSGALFLVFLTVAFFGIAATVLPMTQGKGEKSLPREREPFLAVAVPALFLVVCAVIGLLLPAPLSEILAGASAAFGGSQ
jgi:hydrogenase-4 component F